MRLLKFSFLFFISLAAVSAEVQKKETIKEYKVASKEPTGLLNPWSRVFEPKNKDKPATWRTQSSYIQIQHEILVADSIRVPFKSGDATCVIERPTFVLHNEHYPPGPILLGEGVRLRALEVKATEDKTVFEIGPNDYRIQKISCRRTQPIGQTLTVADVEKTFDHRAVLVVQIKDVEVPSKDELDLLIEKSRSRFP